MLLTLISFLFVFTVITLVHEWGHLFFSKRAGIRVHEFGLGFGPTIWHATRGETVYKLNAIPILGYVKIAGVDTDDPAEKTTPDSEKYFSKPIPHKFMSIFAGALMNLILGFLVYSLVILLAGAATGVSSEIATVSPGSVAAKIGLQPGDKIIALNGIAYNDPLAAIKLIHQSAGKQVQLTIDRQEKKLSFVAVPEYHAKLKVGLIGFSLKPKIEKVNPLLALYYGGRETLGLIILLFALLAKLFVGQISVLDLAGPVGIAQVTGQYAQQGLFSLLRFLAFFSINVAVLNLLPLPALDGGRLFFLLIQAIRRKALPIELENKIHSVGLYVFLGLFAVLTVNDILRLFR